MDIKPVQQPQQQPQNNYGQAPNQQMPNNYAPQQHHYGRPQSDPMQSQPTMSGSAHVKKSHGFIFGYIGLVVLAAAVAGVYYWQHQKLTAAQATISSNQSKINSLTDQNTNLQKENNTLKNQSSSNSTAPTSTATSLVVPDLGITINNIPATLFGLNNNPTSSTMTDVFSTSGLTTADPKCSAANGIGIGSLIKLSGTYSSSTKLTTGQTFVKQLTTGTTATYLVTTKPSTACSTNASATTLQKSQEDLFQTLVTTPANITITASH
jgi:cytoskeletal protein RodZ